MWPGSIDNVKAMNAIMPMMVQTTNWMRSAATTPPVETRSTSDGFNSPDPFELLVLVIPMATAVVIAETKMMPVNCRECRQCKIALNPTFRDREIDIAEDGGCPGIELGFGKTVGIRLRIQKDCRKNSAFYVTL